MADLPTRTGLETERRCLPGFLEKLQRWWGGNETMGVRDAMMVVSREGKIPSLPALFIVLDPEARKTVQELAKRRVEGICQGLREGLRRIHFLVLELNR